MILDSTNGSFFILLFNYHLRVFKIKVVISL